MRFATSIRGKLLVMILLSVIAPLILGLGLLGARDLRRHRADLNASSALFASLVSRYSVAALAFEDRIEAERMLRALGMVPHVQFVALYDDEGRMFASFEPANATNPFAGPTEIDPQPGPRIFADNGFIDVYEPSDFEDRRYGTVLLRVSTEALTQRRGDYLLSLALIGFATLGLALTSALLLQRLVSRPILVLAEVARRITGKETIPPVRAPVTSGDEVGVLAGALNRMLDALETRERERDRAQHALREREEVQRFLAEAATRLAQSLDQAETRRHLAEVAVPRLGRIALVLTETDDRLIGVAGAGWGEASTPVELTADGGGEPVLVAVRRRRPIVLSELPASPDEDDVFAPFRRHGIGALLFVPVVVRDNVYGVLCCGRAASDPPYSAGDVALAEALADCSSFPLENALLYRKAQEAIGARNEFISIASHELKTPLSGLHLVVQTMQRHLSGPEEPRRQLERARDAIGRMARQVNQLRRLVENLLDVSRLSARRLQIEPEEVDLAALVDEVVCRFEAELAEAGCAATVQLERPVFGYWDPLRLEQVITNLISNAAKYGRGKPIEIRLEGTERVARLTVRDHGIGISHDHLERIFGAFERAVTDRAYGGLGLGLYITRRLVEAQGGTIRAESEPGAGSLFVVELDRSGALLHEPPIDAHPDAAPGR